MTPESVAHIIGQMFLAAFWVCAPLLAIEDFDCSLSARPDSIAGKVGADKAGAPASVLA